jgi:hypothetical protein
MTASKVKSPEFRGCGRQKTRTAVCGRPEPFAFAQGKLREGSQYASSFASAQDGAKRAPLRAAALVK